jgi:hypothetical protein
LFIRLTEGRLINLRDLVAAKLGQSISDEMWTELDDSGFVEDAEGMLRTKQVPYLVDRIKQLMSAARSMSAETRPAVPDRPQGAAASARIDALSAVYAAWANADTDVRGFREWELVRHDEAFLAFLQGKGPHPGYELLQPDAVAAWVNNQHDRMASEGSGDEHVRRLVVNRHQGEADLTINLRYIDGRRERIVTVDSRGPLGRLAKLAEKLADRYRWASAGSADFVLTGRAPEVFVYTGSAQIRYGIDSSAATRVTMTLDPFLSPEQVAGIYSRLRGKLHDGQPPRSLSIKYYRLAEHVGPHVQFYVQEPKRVRKAGRPRSPALSGLAQYIDPVPGYSWPTMLHDWNAKYADHVADSRSWRYEHLSNFTRDAQDALIRLLNPRWRMWDR